MIINRIDKDIIIPFNPFRVVIDFENENDVIGVLTEINLIEQSFEMLPPPSKHQRMYFSITFFNKIRDMIINSSKDGGK